MKPHIQNLPTTKLLTQKYKYMCRDRLMHVERSVTFGSCPTYFGRPSPSTRVWIFWGFFGWTPYLSYIRALHVPICVGAERSNTDRTPHNNHRACAPHRATTQVCPTCARPSQMQLPKFKFQTRTRHEVCKPSKLSYLLLKAITLLRSIIIRLIFRNLNI